MIPASLGFKLAIVEAQVNDEPTDDAGGQANEAAEQTAQAKLRDLKPEKDPIGAGNRDAQNPATTR